MGNEFRKLKDVLHLDRAAQLGLQVIRRFSGGGTVIIDRNTILVTLIFDVRLQFYRTPRMIEV